MADEAGPSGASSPAKVKTPRAARTTKRKRATATVSYNEDSGNEGSAGEQREPFTYKAEPEDSDEEQRPLKKEKSTPEVQTKQEEGEDGESDSDYFSCYFDDVDLLVVERHQGRVHSIQVWGKRIRCANGCCGEDRGQGQLQV